MKRIFHYVVMMCAVRLTAACGGGPSMEPEMEMASDPDEDTEGNSSGGVEGDPDEDTEGNSSGGVEGDPDEDTEGNSSEEPADTSSGGTGGDSDGGGFGPGEEIEEVPDERLLDSVCSGVSSAEVPACMHSVAPTAGGYQDFYGLNQAANRCKSSCATASEDYEILAAGSQQEIDDFIEGTYPVNSSMNHWSAFWLHASWARAEAWTCAVRCGLEKTNAEMLEDFCGEYDTATCLRPYDILEFDNGAWCALPDAIGELNDLRCYDEVEPLATPEEARDHLLRYLEVIETPSDEEALIFSNTSSQACRQYSAIHTMAVIGSWTLSCAARMLETTDETPEDGGGFGG